MDVEVGVLPQFEEVFERLYGLRRVARERGAARHPQIRERLELSTVRVAPCAGPIDALVIHDFVELGGWPAAYHVAYPGLSPAAVDTRGRILVSVASADRFYYQTAILDPVEKSFTLVPMAIDGDAAPAGWAPDGRILARGKRYLSSLWRYQQSKGLK
jgi:hypothetical protein